VALSRAAAGSSVLHRGCITPVLTSEGQGGGGAAGGQREDCAHHFSGYSVRVTGTSHYFYHVHNTYVPPTNK
jgi:hypothetical protein